MKKYVVCFLLVAFCTGISNFTHAQLLRKLKEKAEEKILGNDKKSTSDNQQDQGQNSNSNSNSSTGKPVNKGGGGLTNTTPPDVLQQIVDAEKAHEAAKYSDARYSIQQALMGVEIQLGRELLKSLPTTIINLPVDTLQDKISTSQWGWNNMTIQRVYFDNKDKQLTVMIGNNAFYSGFVNMYFNNAFAQADGNNQNVKQVRVKGNKAIIQYDDSKGYTLIAQLGQSTTIVWECINFKDEAEVMAAANAFDIDDIKKRMGEQ